MALDRFIAAAAEAARKGEGHTRPNPPVGAVIVKSGEIVASGYHHRCGCDHAEVDAIRNARALGIKLEDAELYVTLEPCSKPGRVGACTDAIAAAGIRRVRYASQDPNPVNRGKAKAALAAKGIDCDLFAADGPEKELCDRLIAPFAKHVTTGLPFVTVKIAMSLDGKICDDRGDARWISSETARAWTGSMRERVDAIMVGAETVRRDNPSLLSHGARNDDLVRVVVTRSGSLPENARIFTDGAPNRTIVMTVGERGEDRGDRLYAPDLESAMKKLGSLGLMHVLCEGGLRLATSLAQSGLVDEWLTVLSPVVIGDGPIAAAPRPFAFADSRPLSPDIACRFTSNRKID